MKIQGYHISYQILLFLLLSMTFSSLYAHPVHSSPTTMMRINPKSVGDSYVVYTIGGLAVRKISHGEDRGNLLSGLPQGIYIIRSADGTTRKVFVR